VKKRLRTQQYLIQQHEIAKGTDTQWVSDDRFSYSVRHESS